MTQHVKTFLAAVVFGLAIHSVAPPLAAAGKPKAAERVDVAVTRAITYHDIKDDPDRVRHQLDVYRPKGKNNCPVLFFLHGGGWVMGSKDDVLGVYGYGTIAKNLAERGLVVVVPNYRLSPGVRHPEHIKDVARAFAWTCENIEKHGGDKRRVFVGGHSAGGHLAALLATDHTYLKAVARSPSDIRAVLAVSGVYRLDDAEIKVSLADARGSVRFDLNVQPAASIFGTDPKVLKDASPLNHVRPGLPPFLVMSAEFDYPPLARMAKEFTAALKKSGCDVQTKTIAGCTHETMLFDIPRLRIERAAADAMLEFIERHPGVRKR
jgi:acetyl esterase/lipase